MGSEQGDGTSYTTSEPKLCVNGCGFFGTAANMDLCSKCYRHMRSNKNKAASAKAAMEKSLRLRPSNQVDLTPELATDDVDPRPSWGFPASWFSAVGRPGVGSGNEEEKPAQQPKGPARCFSCNKKVGLTGFACKCGSTFCGIHRYPEKHDCTFDFKGSGREDIAKANPVVKPDKLNRI